MILSYFVSWELCLKQASQYRFMSYIIKLRGYAVQHVSVPAPSQATWEGCGPKTSNIKLGMMGQGHWRPK